MEFGVLGPLEVRIDGRTVSLGGPKQRALLALLLLNGNEVVSRDRLIDGLWGERAPESAQRSLDTYVSRLRRLLGGDRIERRPPGYQIRLEPGELDLERFEALLEQGRAAGAASEPAMSRELLGVALRLWRGRALADLESEGSLGAEAERLEERRLLALEGRIDAELQLGAGAELVGELERLVGEHPFRERLLGQLMLSLYRAGRKADALAAYQAGRRRFADELGLELSPELRELERRILEQDAALAAASPPVRPGRRVTRARVVAAGVVLAAVAASVSAGIELGTGGSNASNTRQSRTGVVEITGNSSVGRGALLASAPAAMVEDDRSIWLAEPDAGDVVRIDRDTRQVVETIHVGGSARALTVGGGSVWAASVPGDTIDRIDPTAQYVTQRIHLGNGRVTALAVGVGRLWGADSSDQALLAFDLVTGRRVRTIPIDVHPSALAVGAGAIWITDYDAGALEGIDPRSGLSLSTIRVGDGPAAVAVGDGAVWVANSLDSTVSKVDPLSDVTSAAIPVGNTPVALAVNGTSVSVANEYSSTISRIDAHKGAVVQTTPVGGGPTALVQAGGRIWVGTRTLGAHRGGTLVLLHTHPLWMDTAEQGDLPPFQSDGLTNDALLAYDATNGLLVPDLAVAVPAAADGGTTYTFRLRRDIRYSDGRVVRPEDFRRAIERLFRVKAGWSGNYTSIVGAAACTPSRCDLSRGIVVDGASRTITFRLRSPDPDFLSSMTSMATAPVPPGVPFHYTGFTPIAGTGPYKVASADSHGVRYVRNPHFREWSHAAQPDGNPDVIVMRYGLPPAQEVREVERGQADWTADSVPGSLLPEVTTRFPTHWHSLISTETDFLQLNTKIAPFDDVRVRRALNLALDRAAIVRLYGGRAEATPSCQLLPPGLPGYRRYCPYTRSPGADGRWRATDLAVARRLVAASGTQGDRVTVFGVVGGGVPGTAVIRYTAQVLRELGYRARVRILPLSFYFHARPATWRAMQVDEFSAFDVVPSHFFGLFGCVAGSAHYWYCDPRFDRAVERARTLEVADPHAASELWTKLDREVVDRALAVPLVNPHFVDLVSTRVRDYVANPHLGLIADQVSVR